MTDKTEERLGDAYQLAGQMAFDNPTIDFGPLLDMLAYSDADKTELEVTQADRVLIEAIINDYHTTRLDSDYVSHILSKPRTIAAFARFERDILATCAPDPTPVAWLYELSEANVRKFYETRFPMKVPGWTETPLYAHPPAVPADGLVEMVARAIGTHIMPGSPWEASLRAELAAYRGEA